MRLTVLGAGPAYTDRQGASGACYLVSEDATHVLLDLGQGSFTRIFPHVAPPDLAAVVVSHLHPDHFIDLVPLRHYLRYEFQPPRRMRVLGPAALAERLDALHGGARLHGRGARHGAARRGAAPDRGARPGGPPRHPHGGELRRARRGRRGPGLVYSGDCGRADDLAPLVRPGDVLLAEVSFGPGPVTPGVLHLDGPAVGRVATATGAGRVLLTHLLMGRDPDATVASVRAWYSGPVDLVWPGTRIEL